MKAETQVIRDWIAKAQHDLTSARIILASEEGPTDTVCFHAQQAAEKILKALLIVRSIPFSRTHDIDILLDTLNDTELDAAFRDVSSILTSYAVESRYPGDFVDPEREDAAEAFRIATELFHQVCQKINTETTP